MSSMSSDKRVNLKPCLCSAQKRIASPHSPRAHNSYSVALKAGEECRDFAARKACTYLEEAMEVGVANASSRWSHPV